MDLHHLLTAAEGVGAHLDKGEAFAGLRPGPAAHQDRGGRLVGADRLGELLDALGGVHHVANDAVAAPPRRPDVARGHLAGVDPDAHPDRGLAPCLPLAILSLERSRDRQRGPASARGVVGPRVRCPPEGYHAVAGELADDAALRLHAVREHGEMPVDEMR